MATEIKSVAHFSDLSALAASREGYLVVDFGAVWCGPCKSIAPKYEEFARWCVENGHPHIFVKVDVDVVPELSSAYEVRSLPTFAIMFVNSTINQTQIRWKGVGESGFQEMKKKLFSR